MKLSSTLFLGIAIGILVYILWYTVSSPNKVSGDEAKKLIQENTIDIVLDVRTKMEYTLGHYPEALNIPTGILAEQVETMIPDKKARILIYCNTGQRARWATDVLRAKGYKNVVYITGPYLTLLR